MGAEMGIRDGYVGRDSHSLPEPAGDRLTGRERGARPVRRSPAGSGRPVSFSHLTLATICSVGGLVVAVDITESTARIVFGA